MELKIGYEHTQVNQFYETIVKVLSQAFGETNDHEKPGVTKPKNEQELVAAIKRLSNPG